MLEFESLEWSNFLSYGNRPTKYDFKKGVSRIAGENGTGKSTIVDALWFALFGKTYRKINLGMLVNSINKRDLLVILRFRVDNIKYRIERGLKPNIFRIYQDDELVPQEAKNKSYQEMLEQEILQFNENLADQILVKSLTKNISFLTLGKGPKREIVEGIFDIEIFSTMNKLCKSKLDQIETKILEARKDIDAAKMLLDNEFANVQQLIKLKQQIEDDARKKVEATEEKVQEQRDIIEKCQVGLQKIASFKTRRSDANVEKSNVLADLKELRDQHANLKAKHQFALNKMKVFNSTCPGCPKLKEIEDNTGAEDILQAILSNEAKQEELETVKAALNEKIKKLDELIYNENFLHSKIKTAQQSINDMIESVATTASESIVIDESKMKEFEKQKTECESKYNALVYQKKHLAVVRMLLSDEGIKTYIIKRHLPSINKLLNTYLQKFHTDILFHFDSEFNEVVLTRHKENFNYYSFSEGQKRRMDLAVMFAFMEFAKFKAKKSNNNLLILDEITAGCDAIAENALYDILKEVVNREGKEIITVSHSMAIDPEKVDRLFQVTMERGFSVQTSVEA